MPGRLHERDFIDSEVNFPNFTFFIVVSPRIPGISSSGAVGLACNVGVMAWVRCDLDPAGASGGFKQCLIFVFARVFR